MEIMTTIDIENGGENSYDKLATSMTKELNALSSRSLSSNCCIYRVPERLRCLDKKMYTPKVVSIGPLHHGKPDFKVMEDQKKRYLQYFLQRTNIRIEVYIKKIQIQEASLRNCYQAEVVVGFDSDKFVKIILVDAAFIIELLLRMFGLGDTQNKENDIIFDRPRMINSIIPDMFLLENQVPFVILEELYDSAGIRLIKLPELVYGFLQTGADLEEKEQVDLEKKISLNCKVEHFVDLLRTLHLPSPIRQGPEDNSGRKSSSRPKLQTVVNCFRTALHLPLLEEHPLSPETPSTHNVTYLHRAGVKFKRESRKNLFDIQFKKGILKIPKIKMHDNTELILRNLIAFEQCHCEPTPMALGINLGDYVYMLDQFVNTAEDVDLLVEEKVVVNMLGDNQQVCALINKLGVGNFVSSNNFYFSTLFENLNARVLREERAQMDGNFEARLFQHTLGIYFLCCSGGSPCTQCHINCVLI